MSDLQSGLVSGMVSDLSSDLVSALLSDLRVAPYLSGKSYPLGAAPPSWAKNVAVAWLHWHMSTACRLPLSHAHRGFASAVGYCAPGTPSRTLAATQLPRSERGVAAAGGLPAFRIPCSEAQSLRFSFR